MALPGRLTLAVVPDTLAALSAQIGAVEARLLAEIWLEKAHDRHQRVMAAPKSGQTEVMRKEAHALFGALFLACVMLWRAVPPSRRRLETESL